MKKIVIAEYMGPRSEDGTLLGHCYKVAEEYANMIGDMFEITIVAPQNVSGAFGISVNARYILPSSIIIREKSSVKEKLNDLLCKFKNINQVKKIRNADIYWFYNLDFALMIYLFFNRRFAKKCILTLYRADFGGRGIIRRIKSFVQHSAMKNCKLNIVTVKNYPYERHNIFYMPDYYYDRNIYDKYVDVEKSDYIVCMGTMNRFKLLDETIEAVNNLDMELKIVGKFYDEKWLSELREKAKKNIHIKNAFLDKKEYMDIFSKAKYCIIPYDKNIYNMRTSGVLQECLFFRTIPITFGWFLEQNGWKGVGVDNLDELKDSILKDFDANMYRDWCERKIIEEYDKDSIVRNFTACLKEII